MSIYFLHESSLGYGLFEILGYEKITKNFSEFHESTSDYSLVSTKLIKKVSFRLFSSSEQALENTKAVNDLIVTDDLKSFLSESFPKGSKNKLGCVYGPFAQKINEALGIEIVIGNYFLEISRVIRTHLSKYLDIKEDDIVKSELGLGHSYSRMKCMFDVNREDKPVVQSIYLIDLLDKDINSFCMRIKEWFGWHFPELANIVKDNYLYLRVVKLIETRNNLIENEEELLPKIDEITLDPELTKQIYDSAVISMGADISEGDLYNIKYFTDKVTNLVIYRENLSNYLKEKMKKLAPNTSALVGETVAARLISHSGSLSTLAKYPASTIQILGAEKALFRALKTKQATPKYGLLYNSSFIGKAKAKNKGKISRYLANKIAMCSRIDFFTGNDERFDNFGTEMKKQIEERQSYLEGGEKPRKNVDVMNEVIKGLDSKKTEDKEDKKDKKEKKDKEDKKKKMLGNKRKKEESEDDDDDDDDEESSDKAYQKSKKDKSKGKDKGKKKSKVSDEYYE